MLSNPTPRPLTFPPKMLDALFCNPQPTYNTFVGGRNGGKSVSIARALVVRAMQETKIDVDTNRPRGIRILCCREFKNNIEESIHFNIKNQIIKMGVEDAFIIEKASITCKATGSEFIFAGINKDSVDNIKSISYIDITFIDEAEAIQKDTWKILLPTVIREADSKLIISFNPRMAKSYTYQFFVVNPPPNSRVTKINYIDNPFCSQQAKELAEAAQLSDPDEYINVWLGEPVYNLENAVYAKELRRMVENERFRRVDYIKTVPCDTFWDLGRSDFTSIIIAQIVAGEYRIIDCVETQGKIAIDHIQILRDKGYIYNTWWLPHDAEHKTTAARLTIKEQIMAQSKGICQSVRIVPNIRVLDGINAARTIFDNCYFDEKRCELLVNHLREYQWDTRKEKLTPLHDEHSHMSDAWRYLAVALKPPKPPAPTENEDQFYRSIKQKSGNGWMRG